MRYLTLGEVLELHARVVAKTGGANGLARLAALEAAIALPRQTFGGADLYPTLVEKASILAFALINNHPFVDGNKRAGHAALAVFAALNGYELAASIEESETAILGVAAGRWSQADLGWTASPGDQPMRLTGPVVAVIALAFSVASCGSGTPVGPSWLDLQGTWAMSWTETGGGLSCAWSNVELSFGDSTGVAPTYWGGGQVSCTGGADPGNVTLRGVPLDSLVIGDGRIRFSPRDSRYRFEGFVGAGHMSGTLSNEFLGGMGTWVRSVGQWQATRQGPP